MYAVSPRFFVYRREFARRFSTKKQAEAYMLSAGFKRSGYAAEELGDETECVADISNINK